VGLIQASGIGSNVQVDKIVTAIIDAQKKPATQRLDVEESKTQASITALGSLTSALDAFKTSLSALSSASDFSKRTATSLYTSFVNVPPGATATPANFSVDVLAVAKGTRLESGLLASSTSTVGSGNLTFTAGANTFSVAVGATDSLATIRDTINNAVDNFGVNANIINGNSGSILVLDSSITGAANELSVTNDNASLDPISSNLTIPTGFNAADAQINVNGQTVTNSSNTFTSAIQDVTITAVQKTTASIDLTVSTDTSNVSSAISDLVTKFNDLSKNIATISSSDPKAPGVFSGDAGIRILDRSIRRALTDSVTGLTGNVNSLAEIGITTNQDGTLTLDSAKLNTELGNNIGDIQQIFTSTNGIAPSLTTLIDQYTSSTGILSDRTTSLNNKLTSIGDERLQLSTRLTKLETRLRAQFGAMDTLVAQLNSTGQFLTQQLANLPGFSSSSSSSSGN